MSTRQKKDRQPSTNHKTTYKPAPANVDDEKIALQCRAANCPLRFLCLDA